ncbi:HD family hydrolase [Kitasatospora sp. NPDC058162]|uniref:HD domain-containing protein n=1 Tax=Kitasatospora sp. NPDC058162 TaxID=3346362 RepID=UPI0036DD2B47
MTDDLTSVARFLFEAGTLKQTKRTGWWMAGVRDPESVAEHSWRTALIASVIAKLEGADPAQAAFLAVWHDSQETRTGDVNHLGKKYASGADPAAVTADQVAGMPTILASAIQDLVAEYEGKQTPEAVCARDADKLECMIQGVEYKAQGYANAQRWIDNSRGRLTTKSGNALAEAILASDSLDWLRAALGEKPLDGGRKEQDGDRG